MIMMTSTEKRHRVLQAKSYSHFYSYWNHRNLASQIKLFVKEVTIFFSHAVLTASEGHRFERSNFRLLSFLRRQALKGINKLMRHAC